eukprot:1395532-Amorphochlora_amoeboformis.AAC.1
MMLNRKKSTRLRRRRAGSALRLPHIHGNKVGSAAISRLGRSLPVIIVHEEDKSKPQEKVISSVSGRSMSPHGTENGRHARSLFANWKLKCVEQSECLKYPSLSSTKDNSKAKDKSSPQAGNSDVLSQHEVVSQIMPFREIDNLGVRTTKVSSSNPEGKHRPKRGSVITVRGDREADYLRMSRDTKNSPSDDPEFLLRSGFSLPEGILTEDLFETSTVGSTGRRSSRRSKIRSNYLGNPARHSADKAPAIHPRSLSPEDAMPAYIEKKAMSHCQ